MSPADPPSSGRAGRPTTVPNGRATEPGVGQPPGEGAGDARRNAPAAERNREPILAVLRGVIPADSRVVEIASGTGQHAAYFAAALPSLRWQPTERDPAALASIDAWVRSAAVDNVDPAIVLDVTALPWPVGDIDAIFNANMIHIAPWECCLALVNGAGRHLPSGGLLITYGPYRMGGAHTAASNERFDASLRSQDPSWGVRDLESVCDVAAVQGLVLGQRVAMPANNQILVFVRS